MLPIVMPQVGQDIPTARIVEWAKQEGDVVRKGEVVAVVESDKATFEVQAEAGGSLLKILVPAGEESEVFKPIAWLGQPGEVLGPMESVSTALAEDTLTDISPGGTGAELIPFSRPLATPAVRRVAREAGVDLSTLKGTGPRGRILKEDVLAAAALRKEARVTMAATTEKPAPLAAPVEPAPATPGEDQIIPFSRMRQRIAERLTLSKQTIPHFYLFQEVNMTESQRWRKVFNGTPGAHVTVTDLVIHATAQALVEFRRLNAQVEKDRLIVRHAVNVGVATAVEDGLLVPVIPTTDRKDLMEISRLSKQNSEAARRGMVDPTVQATFTVSSLGQFGIPLFLPIINPPECAILAVGAVQPRVVPIADGLGVREMMTLTLAGDHRAVDGEYAARFLARLKQLLETPPCSGVSSERRTFPDNKPPA